VFTSDAARIRSLKGAMVLGLAALFACSWSLWLSHSDVPSIPWLSFAVDAPMWVDAVAIAVVLFGLLGLLMERSHVRWPSVLVCLGLVLSVLLDQHRLQPWVWQIGLLNVLLLISPNASGLRGGRWLIISLYSFSAISKFDFAFLQSHGQMLIQGVITPINGDVNLWPEQRRLFVAGLLPVGEMAVAMLLCFARTQRIGLYASIIMHAVLILALGPFGLNHEPGVLIWNGFFIVQNLILFSGHGSVSRAVVVPVNTVSWNNRLCLVTAAGFAILPVFEPFGTLDHWPGWAVYCSRPAQVRCLIHQDEIKNLPLSLQRCGSPPAPLSEMCPVNFDSWSFSERHVPMYPQERYRLAIILAMAESSGLREESVVVEVHSSPDRWTGERSVTEYRGQFELSLALERYVVNTRAR